MSAFTVTPDNMRISDKEGLLASYEFGSCIARHYFCSRCGIYPFHQTLRKKHHYRVNLGCVAAVDAGDLDYEIFDGASL